MNTYIIIGTALPVAVAAYLAIRRLYLLNKISRHESRLRQRDIRNLEESEKKRTINNTTATRNQRAILRKREQKPS